MSDRRDVNQPSIMELLDEAWDMLMDAGRAFDIHALVHFITDPVYAQDENLAIYYASKRHASRGLIFDGRVVHPSDFGYGSRPDVVQGGLGMRLANPPGRHDEHGNRVAMLAQSILSDRRNRIAPHWRLEAARELAKLPCGLQVRYVLEWTLADWNEAQLLLLSDVEAYLRKMIDPYFKVMPVEQLSSAAQRWGLSERGRFLASLPRAR